MNQESIKDRRRESALADLVNYVAFVLEKHGVEGDEAKYVIFNHAAAHLHAMKLTRAQAIKSMTQLINDKYDYLDALELTKFSC